MTEAIYSLLSNCQSHTPPFEELIDSTLLSLNTSRFHFALQLKQTLESDSEDHGSSTGSGEPVAFTDRQRLCLICTLFVIGNGFSASSKNKSWKAEGNAFSSFLDKYKEKGAVYEMLNVNTGNDDDGETSMGTETTSAARLQPNYAAIVPPAFYRPSPLRLPSRNGNGYRSPIQVPLHFLHTSDPNLRYEWMLSEPTNNAIDHDENSQELLLQKAFHTPLGIEEEELLISTLKNEDERRHDEHGNERRTKPNANEDDAILTPGNLPQLVQNNPTIAIEILMASDPLPFSSLSYNESAYHSALVNMDITLHTMEVVYKLATSHKLNIEYLHVFVLGLFERCAETEVSAITGASIGMADGNLSNGTTGGGMKMVRLVSVFLQNLIQNDIVHVEDFVEVQAFCIENSRVREANTLFKLLKEKRGRR